MQSQVRDTPPLLVFGRSRALDCQIDAHIDEDSPTDPDFPLHTASNFHGCLMEPACWFMNVKYFDRCFLIFLLLPDLGGDCMGNPSAKRLPYCSGAL